MGRATSASELKPFDTFAMSTESPDLASVNPRVGHWGKHMVIHGWCRGCPDRYHCTRQGRKQSGGGVGLRVTKRGSGVQGR
jgi:hypothetical protein